jgi:hypothetical protein
MREPKDILVQDGKAVLRPAEKLNLKQLVRTFTLRTSEGFVENFGPALIARFVEEAPGVLQRRDLRCKRWGNGAGLPFPAPAPAFNRLCVWRTAVCLFKMRPFNPLGVPGIRRFPSNHRARWHSPSRCS